MVGDGDREAAFEIVRQVAAAAAAAACTSRGVVHRGRLDGGEFGKLSGAEGPRRQITAASYALAAISAVGKEPSQMRVRLLGSRISDTHLPQERMRTPLYDGGVVEEEES